MSGQTDGWTRVDWARWFIEHDEVDEAAWVLEPGDELMLGRSDYLDLAAALARRGLGASYELRTVRVQPGRPVADLAPDRDSEPVTGDLATSARKPPARNGGAPGNGRISVPGWRRSSR